MIIGLDIGSRLTKIVIFEADSLSSFQIQETMSFYRKCGRSEDGRLEIDLASVDVSLGTPRLAGLSSEDRLVVTGYGRHNLNFPAARIIPEPKAHMLGAIFQTGLKDFTLLDIGGQDTKVVRVVGGKMTDFLTNDRCAASSGRYLENMAAALQLPLEELGQYYLNPAALSATCAVFGETELINRLVEGADVATLAAGVNWSIWHRTKPLLAELVGERIVFTGGVARSRALVEIIRAETGREVVVPENPELNGAIGCAVAALTSVERPVPGRWGGGSPQRGSPTD